MKQYLRFFAKESVLLEAGNNNETFFLIKTGSASAIRMVQGEPEEVAVLGPGHCIGLISDALGITQEDTIIARTDLMVYVLDYQTLLAESGGSHQPIAVVLEGVIQQLEHSRSELEDELNERE